MLSIARTATAIAFFTATLPPSKPYTSPFFQFPTVIPNLTPSFIE